MTTIGLALIFLAAVPATLVVGLYVAVAAFWRSLMGRAFVTTSAALALVLDFSLAFHFWPGHEGIKIAVAYAVYALVAAGCWMMLAAFLRALRDRRL